MRPACLVGSFRERAGRGRPSAAKRRCGPRVASVAERGRGAWPGAVAEGGCSAARHRTSDARPRVPDGVALHSPHCGLRPAHARSPRIPGSRWPPRPGHPRACCSGRRCCSWQRCSLWLPQPDPQVCARLTQWLVRLSSSLPTRLSLWGPLSLSDSVLPACVSCH